MGGSVFKGSKHHQHHGDGIIVDHNIGQSLDEDMKVEIKKIKVLLLGTGESGKSTIFKQMVYLHGVGLAAQKRIVQGGIQLVIIDAMRSLISRSYDLAEKFPSIAREFNISIELRDGCELLRGNECRLDDNTARIIYNLWKDQGIRKTYEYRSMLHIPDNIDYFFDKVLDIANPKYEITDEDVFKIRIRSTGMAQEVFDFDRFQLVMVDVGGQRSERKKWLPMFDGVTAVIFVAAVSEYNQNCFEDDLTPRWQESLEVFQQCVNAPSFDRTDFILFFNKADLFREKFGIFPLQDSIPEFKGETVEEGLEFMKSQYLRKMGEKKALYSHFTVATDPDLMQKVLEDVRSIVIKKNIERTGIELQ